MSVTLTKFGNPLKGIADGVAAGNLELVVLAVSEAKALAPKGETLFLTNSITWKTPDQAGTGEAGSLAVIPKKGEAYYGTAVEYGIYQEFGTRKMAPQPYLRPAAEITKGADRLVVLAKINEENMKGALKKGQTRVWFR